MNKEQLLKIERGFWHSEPDYYREHITDDAVFVFPGMVLGKEEGIASTNGQSAWNDLEITDARFIRLAEDIGVLTYHASATRNGKEAYMGNITTIYKKDNGRPRMAFHQHSPDPQQ